MRFEAAVRLEDKVEVALNNKDWEAGYTAYKDILVGEWRGGGSSLTTGTGRPSIQPTRILVGEWRGGGSSSTTRTERPGIQPIRILVGEWRGRGPSSTTRTGRPGIQHTRIYW